MSKILVNIDYIKMAQLVKFMKFCIKQNEKTQEPAHLNNMESALTAMIRVLDEAVDPDVLKRIKGYE